MKPTARAVEGSGIIWACTAGLAFWGLLAAAWIVGGG